MMPPRNRSETQLRLERIRHSWRRRWRLWKRSTTQLKSGWILIVILILVGFTGIWCIGYFLFKSNFQDKIKNGTITKQSTHDLDDFEFPQYSKKQNTPIVRLCGLSDVNESCKIFEPGEYDANTYSLRSIGRVSIGIGYEVIISNSLGTSYNMKYGLETCLEKICLDVQRIIVKHDIYIALAQIKRMIVEDLEFIYVRPPSLRDNYDKDTVTLVTQFSVNRLDRFERSIDEWEGPISVVIYLVEPTDIDELILYFSHKENLNRYNKVTITIVKPNYSSDSDKVKKRLQYPINRLRNLGIHAVSTQYILVIDADFVPSKDLSQSGVRNAVNLINNLKDQKVVIVIPCLALSSRRFLDKKSHLPKTTSELSQFFKNGTAFITDPNAGHGPTRTKAFLSNYLLSKLVTYEVCYESQWEPYYITSIPQLKLFEKDDFDPPLYDERFRNQGGDKQAHALHLNALGYKFIVLPEYFLMHIEHGTMSDNSGFQWPGGMDFSESQRVERRFTYFENYLPEMTRRYGNNVRWPKGCKDPFFLVEQRDLLGIAARAGF